VSGLLSACANLFKKIINNRRKLEWLILIDPSPT
jgi:hypothetical protein